MEWITWAKNLIELLGASMTLIYIIGRVVMWGVKLNLIVKDHKLHLNRNQLKREKTDLEKVYSERDP